MHAALLHFHSIYACVVMVLHIYVMVYASMQNTYESMCVARQTWLWCRPAILFLAFVIDAAFALAIVGFLIMHCRMIARNMTTIEMYEKRRNATGAWPFDRGARHNFLEVFGRRYDAFVRGIVE